MIPKHFNFLTVPSDDDYRRVAMILLWLVGFYSHDRLHRPFCCTALLLFRSMLRTKVN